MHSTLASLGCRQTDYCLPASLFDLLFGIRSTNVQLSASLPAHKTFIWSLSLVFFDSLGFSFFSSLVRNLGLCLPNPLCTSHTCTHIWVEAVSHGQFNGTSNSGFLSQFAYCYLLLSPQIVSHEFCPGFITAFPWERYGRVSLLHLT